MLGKFLRLQSSEQLRSDDKANSEKKTTNANTFFVETFCNFFNWFKSVGIKYEFFYFNIEYEKKNYKDQNSIFYKL
jgi:hypothetical protein